MDKTKTAAIVRARMDAELKAKAEEALAVMGLTPGQAIRMFYRRIVKRQALPFFAHVPNVETARVLREADAGLNLLGPYDDVDHMFREMGFLDGDTGRTQAPTDDAIRP